MLKRSPVYFIFICATLPRLRSSLRATAAPAYCHKQSNVSGLRPWYYDIMRARTLKSVREWRWKMAVRATTESSGKVHSLECLAQLMLCKTASPSTYEGTHLVLRFFDPRVVKGQATPTHCVVPLSPISLDGGTSFHEKEGFISRGLLICGYEGARAENCQMATVRLSRWY